MKRLFAFLSALVLAAACTGTALDAVLSRWI